MDTSLNTKRAALLSAFESALTNSARDREDLNKGRMGKLKKYPPKVLLSKLMIKMSPRVAEKFVIKNKLFSGALLFTEGYYMDYYLCGLPNSDPEIRLTKYLIKHLEGGDIFFDVGANFGFFTVLARSILGDIRNKDGGQIHSFEPTPSIFRILTKNGSCDNAALNNFALGAIEGEADFVFFDSIKEFNGLSATINKEEFKVVGHKVNKVMVRTLDGYCEERHVFPTVIKIDTEGSECDVIDGGLSVIAEHRPKIAMEVQPRGVNERHRAAVKKLLEIGYSLYRIDATGELVAVGIPYIENLEKLDNVIFVFNGRSF